MFVCFADDSAYYTFNSIDIKNIEYEKRGNFFKICFRDGSTKVFNYERFIDAHDIYVGLAKTLKEKD